MELKEKDLVHRLQQAQSSGQSVDQQWYSDAATFLHHAEHAEHWWCRHAVLARGLAQLLVYHDGEAVVQRIWAEMSKQLSQCAQCVMEYHSAQAYFKETLDEAASDPLLAVMRRLDEERLAAVLGEAPAVQSGEDLRPSLVTALFEALSYDSLLEDREVMQKLQAALLHLSRSCELAWADGGRYPGLYRLMAHPDTAVRSLIAPIVKELGPFADELELGSISSVLDHWMHLLQFDLFEVAQASAGGRERFNQPREPLWLALNALLHMLRPPAMHALVQWYGLLPEVVVNHLGAAGRVGRCAVGCLRSLLDGLGGKVWQFSLGGAQRVVEVLLQAAFRSREPPLHAEIVRVFRPLLKSCETGKVRAVQRKVFFFLLHQVPASGNFTPLSRTIAQTTAFDIMAACLRAGRPICQDMDIYGPALCNIVHEVPQQAAVKSHGMAVAICIALIQADACALAALLQASHTSSVTALLAVRSSEGCGVDVGQACHLAAQNADTWECTPALWQGLSQCQQPQISAAMSWPRQCSVDAAATCSVRASEHAGLLLQASRKAACTHLGWLLRRKQPFHAAGTPLLAQAVESLLRLLFGVHAPLRDLAREVLQRHTQEASLADVLSSLLWTPANVEAVSGAAAAAVQWLQAAPVSQVMVSTAGQHALAFLDALFLAAANHPHGGNLDLEAVVPPLWDFVMGVLDEGAPAAKLLTARQAHTHMFSLLPVLWTLLAPLEELQPDDLLWIGAALQYGLLLDTALVEGWARAMQKVLHGLPSPATELLPPEVLQIAAQAMSSHNGLPDSARLLLAPHLGRLAPGNLGQIWPEAWPRKTVPGTAAGTARQALKRPSMRRPGAGPPPKRLKAALEDHLQQQAKLQRAMDRNQRGNVADGRMRQAQTHDSGRSEASRERAAQRQPGVPRPRSRTASPARELEMSHHRQGHVGGHAANATSREPSPFEYRPEPQLASRPPSRPQSREPSPNPNMLDLEEDHDLDAELSAFRQAQQPRDDNAMLSRLTMPNAAPAVKVQRRTIQLAAVPGHVSTAQWAQRRVAQPAAEPPPQAALTVEQVQQELLAWDYFALLAGKTGGGAALMGGKVPKAFSSIGHYTRVFRGLLLEELRAHVQKAHEDWSKLKGRSESSSLSFPLQLRENQKHSVLHNMVFSQDCADRDHYCRAEDLLLLTRRPLAALPAEKDDKVPSVHLLGLVMKAERDEASGGRSRNVHVIANLGTEVVGRDAQRLEAAQKALLQGTTWHVTRIMSWTPHLRQFLALCRAFSLPPPLLQQILHPQPPSQGHAAPRLDRCALPPGLHQALAADYNSSQQRAIAASLGGSGQFTLVQGPPGTGKTAAILAIVSGILAKNPSTGHSTVANAEPSKKGSKKHKGGTAGVAACAGPSKEGSKKHTGGTAGVAADAAIPQACLVMGQPPPARVLVCAQSNAAIDELIARLAVQGLYRAPGGRRECPSMLRMGKLETAHPLVQAFHIDAVAQRFEGTEDSTTTAVGEVERAKQRTQELRSRLAQLQQQINEPASKVAMNLSAMLDRKRQLRLELNKAQSEYKSGGERVARARREVRQAVVKSAEVVACTLSSAGGDLLSLLKTGPFFNALIIDEAAQALEPAALIALQLVAPSGRIVLAAQALEPAALIALQLVAPSGRIVLVGDPKQLPATVISRAAEAANLAQSLFERLQQAGYPVAMLSEQYRMHPAISAWPSAFFYDGKLVDGRGIREGGERDAAFHKQPCFPPLAFYDCLEGRERAGSREGSGGSLSNALEAELACTLYTGVMRQYAAELGSVAVLTPYRAQLSTLRSVFRRAHGEDGIANIDFATVDGFQGKEADVVIFSCVRAHQLRSGMGSVGFLADVRRMNVALTRARRALWIIGHSQTLLSSPPWKALIEHTQHHACFFRTHHPFASILTASKKQLQGR
ncbi:hypothetical protein WJX72_012414 [[Myrmecia] bisecta]|uniref:AAA+ ATPase domain-containing protein n=1 Tax=[Myrmecia] bisecta TaxID=41462 RepID=A0AAW1R976_9CHLO